MAVGTGTALVVGTTMALTAASTGLAMYGANESAASQRGIASQNAEIMRKNAELQLRAERMEAEGEIYAAGIDKQNAELALRGGQISEANAILEGVGNEFAVASAVENAVTNSRLARIDVRIGRRNARTLTRFATTIETVGRERIGRIREEGRRAMGIVRNRVAASGLVMEGSPLIVAADNAANIELAAQDANYAVRSEARDVRTEAQNIRKDSRRSLLVGRQERRNAKTALDSLEISRIGVAFNIAGAQLEQEAAGIAMDAAEFRKHMGYELLDLAGERYELSLEEAGITKSAGYAQARATELSAIGTAISGASSIADTSYQYFGKRS